MNEAAKDFGGLEQPGHGNSGGAASPTRDLYRGLVEHSYDLIGTPGLKSTLLFVNPLPARILGHERAAEHLRLMPEIRDDSGDWRPANIHRHSEGDFTHGICPGCASQLCPEYSRK